MSQGLCESRACVGPPKAVPVWYGAGASSHVCPVLSFTPDVDDALDWFDQCYELSRDASGQPTARRVCLPHAGALADQDAKLMDQLAVIAQATLSAVQVVTKADAPKEPTL